MASETEPAEQPTETNAHTRLVQVLKSRSLARMGKDQAARGEQGTLSSFVKGYTNLPVKVTRK